MRKYHIQKDQEDLVEITIMRWRRRKKNPLINRLYQIYSLLYVSHVFHQWKHHLLRRSLKDRSSLELIQNYVWVPSRELQHRTRPRKGAACALLHPTPSAAPSSPENPKQDASQSCSSCRYRSAHERAARSLSRWSPVRRTTAIHRENHLRPLVSNPTLIQRVVSLDLMNLKLRTVPFAMNRLWVVQYAFSRLVTPTRFVLWVSLRFVEDIGFFIFFFIVSSLL